MEKEIRSFNTFEIRQVGEGEEKQTHIQGYALIFDSISENLGFREIIQRGALDNCDLSDVVLNFNHKNDKILARNNKNNGSGSLVLTIDDKGLFFDAIPTDTTSFAFNIDWSDDEAQTWDWDDGTRGFDLRTIHKIAEISDCSIVVNPAYESTSSTIYKRSKEEYMEEKEKTNELRKLELELMELELS